MTLNVDAEPALAFGNSFDNYGGGRSDISPNDQAVKTTRP